MVQPDLFGEVRERVPFSEDLLNRAIHRSFAPGRLAGVVAIVGGPARKPIRQDRGWCVMVAGERRRLVEAVVIRRPAEPEDYEFIAEAAPDSSTAGVGGSRQTWREGNAAPPAGRS